MARPPPPASAAQWNFAGARSRPSGISSQCEACATSIHRDGSLGPSPGGAACLFVIAGGAACLFVHCPVRPLANRTLAPCNVLSNAVYLYGILLASATPPA